MHKSLAASLLAISLGAVPVPATESQEELETVVVTGEVPGPGLWKVTKDDHVMWVLASYSLCPGA